MAASAASAAGELQPVIAFALVGVLGVGSQWVAWRLRMPAIVLMLLAGVLIGPVSGVLDPSAAFGDLLQPMIAVAVAIILFEGGLTLNFHKLAGAGQGVQRLVFLGAPLGWLASTLTLHYGAGLSWETSAVFGGIMIVTGPTVIAPLLRQARLSKRPAALLQWEAIINDPIGALAAVLAFEYVVLRQTSADMSDLLVKLPVGIVFATVVGLAAGYVIAWAFKRGKVPEYMKVPVLFAGVLGAFAVSDALLHESGLLAVTVIGVYLANADLPSYVELRRFKEHATVLLVSGVFILLAANLDFGALAVLDARAILFVALVILVARPVVVFLSLLGSKVPFKEQALVALTGPRGVVLVAVAGLFGERLAAVGISDGAVVAPLAFALVAATVVLHGFTLAPVARALGLTGGAVPGVIVMGGSKWTTALAEALQRAEIPVLVSDPNHGKLRSARAAGIPTFSGDILAEAAEDRLEFVSYATVLAATDNDAYNTLVSTDFGPEFGRANVAQVAREGADSHRHALPRTLVGRPIGNDQTLRDYNGLIADGWTFRVTELTDEFTYEDWRAKTPEAILMAVIGKKSEFSFVRNDADRVAPTAGQRLISMQPAQPV